MAAGYIYQPLAAASREIRLLEINPSANDEADFFCRIKIVSLDDEPHFEALSYVWGTGSEKHRIFVDGAYLEIGKNLNIAMRYLRSHVHVRTFWIDAVCINQEDMQERGQQVQIMRDIYSSADKVVSWLGEPVEDTEKGLKIVDFLSKNNHDSAEDFHEGLFQKTPIELGIMAIFQYPVENWYALRKIWDRPYWRRIWIVQELAVSYKSAAITIGRQSYLLEDFYKAFIVNVFKHPAIHSRGDPSWCGELFAIALLQDRESYSLLSLLHRTTFFQATDLRDKVYALLGLVNNSADRYTIYPDYDKPLVDLCKELVRYLVESRENLAILHGNRCENQAEGPSWLPRFKDPLGTPFWSQNVLSFDAAGSSKSEATFSSDLAQMTIRGFTVGTVGKVYGPFRSPFDLATAADPGPILAMEATAVATLSHGAVPAPDDLLVFREAFWRTLIGNHGFHETQLGRTYTVLTRYPAPPEYGELYETLVRRAGVPEDFGSEGQDDFSRWTDYMWPFWVAMQHNLRDRCFFVGEDNYIGVAPQGTREGDLFVVAFGSAVPLVLREEEGLSMLVGDAYVHGIMDGQLMEFRKYFGTENMPTREFIML